MSKTNTDKKREKVAKKQKNIEAEKTSFEEQKSKKESKHKLLQSEIFSKIILPVAVNVLVDVILFAIVSAKGYIKSFLDIPKDIKEMRASIGNLTSSNEKMHDAIIELQAIQSTSGTPVRVDISDTRSGSISLKSDGVLAELVRSYDVSNTMEEALAEPPWRPEQIIAEGSDGTEYKAYDLYDTRILFSYKENGQDIIFSGQINENNHWDGSCLFNVFENENFVIATEAYYDDGNRLYYEQLFPKDEEWVYAERYSDDGGNAGDTWKFQKVDDIIMEADLSALEEDDMIIPREFIIPLGQKRTGHYHGNTSGGEYNDDTGEAYLISYDTNGYVRTVYKGRFAGGVFEDNTAKAWYITRESKTNQELNYQYYRGEFRNGHPVPENERSASSIFDEKITMEEANRIIAGEAFNSEVRWNESKFYYDDKDSE